MLKTKYKLLTKAFSFSLQFFTYQSLYGWNFPDRNAHWISPRVNGSGGIEGFSENFTDRAFFDPSFVAPPKQKFELLWGSLGVVYSSDLAKSLNHFIKFATKSQSQGDAQIINQLDELKAIFGKRLNASANLGLFGMRIGSFKMVPYGIAHVTSGLDIPSWPEANIQIQTFSGLLLSYSLPLYKTFSLGLSLRPGLGNFATGSVSVSDAASLSKANSSTSGESKLIQSSSATYLPLDAALAWTPSPIWRLSLVFRTLGGAPPLKVLSGKRPPVLPMSVNTGATVIPWKTATQQVQWGLEIHDAMGLNQASGLWYRTHFGAQYTYRLPFRNQTTLGFQGGLNQGYLCGGLFVDLFVLKIEGAVYTRESGYTIGSHPERRYVLRAMSQFSF